MAMFRIFLVAVLLGGAVSTAWAADDFGLGSEPGTEDLLKQGIALRRSGNDEAALAVFLDLEKRAPDSVRLLLHIATAAQATGKWIMAYEYMQKAATHRDEPYYQRHRGAIDNVEKTISQRVGQFRARGTPAGAEVRLNGEVIGSLPLTAVRAVEVGSYVLEVYKPGFYPMRRPITISGGGGLTQESIDLRERGASLAAGGGPGLNAAEGSVGADTGPTTPQSWWKQRWVTWTLAGVGVAAAATSGVAFAIREKDAAKWNDNNGECIDRNNINTPRGVSCANVHNDLKFAEGVSIAAGVTAVAFGGAALIHLLTTQRGPSDTPAPQAHGGCSPGLGSVVCYGSF